MDSQKVDVDLPDWDMQPVAPEPERRRPPARPRRLAAPTADAPGFVDHSSEPTDMVSLDEIQTVEREPAPSGAASRDAPGFVDHSSEPTDMVSLDEIQTVEREPAPSEAASRDAPGFVDHSSEPTDMVSLDEIQTVEREPAPSEAASRDAPGFVDHSSEPTDMVSLDEIQTMESEPARPAPVQPAVPRQAPVVRSVQPAGGDGLRRGDPPDETTQPRARQPQPPAARGRVAVPQDERPDSRGAPSPTAERPDYDPERLKRILAQAQAEAAARSRRDPGSTVYIVIGAILAATIVGAAVVIALFI
jgi:hypothetical protein